jgi:hypothetical protein
MYLTYIKRLFLLLVSHFFHFNLLLFSSLFLDLSPGSNISFSFDLLPVKKEEAEGEKEEENPESSISVSRF